MPSIDPDKVCHIIVKARALSAKTDSGISDAGSFMIHDNTLYALAP